MVVLKLRDQSMTAGWSRKGRAGAGEGREKGGRGREPAHQIEVMFVVIVAGGRRVGKGEGEAGTLARSCAVIVSVIIVSVLVTWGCTSEIWRREGIEAGREAGSSRSSSSSSR
jgi:hypothetical protein